jgi:hypothetical protein
LFVLHPFFSNSLKTRRVIIMRTIKFLLAILFSLAVVACGGGGYGGGSMGGGNGGGIYMISGTVSGGATDHSGVMISLAGGTPKAPITTVAGGSYSFTGLANGNYMVTPSRTGYGFAPSSASVTVSLNNPANINFTEAP